jgi:hypothetical protein
VADILKADGLDEAILGVGYKFGMDPVLVYDTEKILKILMERDGMDYEEAREFFDFNILGAGFDGSPVFVEEFIEDLW